MFAYLGQAAAISAGGAEVLSNPFYQSVPGGTGGGLWWLTWIMGVIACVSTEVS